MANWQFDKRAVQRSFRPGDSVLALLPIPGSLLHNRCDWPYVFEKKLSNTGYVIDTPDRKRKSRVCHINMLKSYAEVVCADITGDGLTKETPTAMGARIQNSKVVGSYGYLCGLSFWY